VRGYTQMHSTQSKCREHDVDYQYVMVRKLETCS